MKPCCTTRLWLPKKSLQLNTAIPDASIYRKIKQDAGRLAARDMAALQEHIFRCAGMHMQHIGDSDPFEKGTSRPLDFGHWEAHKLEQFSGYRLRTERPLLLA